MNCTQAQKIISRFIDGELSPEAARELSAHCAGCSACREEKEAGEALRAVVRTPAVIAPSPYFFAKVQRRIEERERVPAFSRTSWAYRLAVSAAVAFMLITGARAGSTLYANFIQQGTQIAEQENLAEVTVFQDLSTVLDDENV